MKKLMLCFLLVLALAGCEDNTAPDTSLDAAPDAPAFCKVQTYDRGVHAFRYLCEIADGKYSLMWLNADGDYVRDGCHTIDKVTCL